MSASTTARRAAAFGAGLVLGLSVFSGVAFGTPTEDTDTNDGGTPNHVVDDGDNRHPSGKDRSVEHGKSGNQGKAASDPDDDTRGPERTNRGADKADGPGGDDLADQDGNNGCGNDDDFEDDNEGHCRRARSSSAPSGPSAGPASPGSPKSPKSPKSPNGPKSPKGPKSPNSPGSPGSPGSPTGGTPSNPSSPSTPTGSTTGSPAGGGAVLSATDEAATLSSAVSVTAGRPAEVLGVSLVAPASVASPAASAAGAVASRRSGRATEVLGVTYSRSGAPLARTGAESSLVLMGFGGVALLALGLGLTRWARWARPGLRAAH